MLKNYHRVREGDRVRALDMGFRPGGHTQMSFFVDDVVTVVKHLKSKGVVFEEYDLPNLKTVDSIAERPDVKAAWFKDSEGNMIGVGQTAVDGHN